MVVIESYPIAVVTLLVVMICWGSWPNTLKLAGRKWPFQLFYWDYSVGVLLFSLIMAFTMGSMGAYGRSFVKDIAQAAPTSIALALIGGVVFNVYNVLLVSAVDIAGMAVAFPLGVGLALIIGVVANYLGNPLGNPLLLFGGLLAVTLALFCTAGAYKRVPSEGQASSTKGIVISVVSGIFGGFFYRFVAASMSTNFIHLEAGKLGPYTAVVLFAVGLLASNIVFISFVMAKPFVGEPVRYADYVKLGSPRRHAVGVLGGLIWCVGMSFSIIASGAAGFAVSYGLAQGCTMIAAIWGVFVWKEFRTAQAGTSKLLAAMFACYLIGLSLIILARTV